MDPELTRSETEALLQPYHNPDNTSAEDSNVDWDPSFMETEIDMEETESFIEVRKKIKALTQQGTDQKEESLKYRIEEVLENDLLMVAQVSKDDLKKEEINVESERNNFQEHEYQAYDVAMKHLVEKEQTSEARILKSSYTANERMDALEADALEKTKHRSTEIYKSFKQSEKRMKQIIKLRRDHTMTYFGVLDENKEEKKYSTYLKKTFSKWTRTPQPLEIRVEQARCIKDRLPCAHFVILISLWDRLGGNVIEFAKIKPNSEWKRVTTPKRHAGRHFSNTLRFEENMRMLGPSPLEARPTMVVSFELFMLRSRQVTYDKCVAFGMFPLMNSDFEMVEGKFKVPLIRGEIDLSVDRYSDLEAIYSQDIDSWMCNLYFSMRRIPTAQDEEFAQDLFPVQLDQDVTITENSEGEFVIGTPLAISAQESLNLSAHRLVKDEERLDSMEGTFLEDQSFEKDATKGAKDAKNKGNKDKYAVREEEIQPIVYKTLESPEDYEEYRFGVTAADGLKSRNQAWNKLRYIMTEIWADMGFRTIKNAEFWVTFLILCMTCWVSRFTHYIGQWFFLKGQGVAVQNFEAVKLTIDLDYATDTDLVVEVGVIMVGVLFQLALFCIICVIGYIWVRWKHPFPGIAFRMIICYGLAITFDWAILLLESILFGFLTDDWRKDSFKLYNYFEKREGYGAIGVFLTVFIYLALKCLCCIFMYLYIIHVHMNGRLIDNYSRITGPDNIFFIPYDTEVSEKYLKWVIFKARQYKSLAEEKKKVAIQEYILTDATDPTIEEVTTHILIFNINKHGDRTVYRQFIKQPNGSICEVGSSNGNDAIKSLNKVADKENPEYATNMFKAKIQDAVTKSAARASVRMDPGAFMDMFKGVK